MGFEIRARALLAACSEQATFSGESQRWCCRIDPSNDRNHEIRWYRRLNLSCIALHWRVSRCCRWCHDERSNHLQNDWSAAELHSSDRQD